MMKKIIFLGICYGFSWFSPGQDMAEEYENAVSFWWENLNEKAFNLHVEPHWFSDSTGLWFERQSAGSKTYQKIKLPSLERSELFDHTKLAKILSDSLEEEVEAGDLPLSDLTYLNPKELQFTAKGRSYIFNIETATLKIREKEEKNEMEKASPDGKWIAYSEDYNLFIRSTESDEVRQLSTDGKKGYEYATWYGWGDIMEGENGDRPPRFSVEWSDDSEWIRTTITDFTSAQKMYLLDWSVDTLFRPRLLSYYRGSPGDTGMIHVEPVFFHVPEGSEIKPELTPGTHINSTGARFSNTPGKVYLSQTTRGYQKINLYVFDLSTGQLELLYAESSATNIDNFSYRLAEDSGLIFFLSEKSGWKQLYSLDIVTKKISPITKGQYFVHRIDRIDEDNETLLFTASGKDSDNPYYRSQYRVAFDGTGLTNLTPEDQNHSVYISPDGRYFFDNISTVNTPTQTVLRGSSNGDILVNVAEAKLTGLDDWSAPEIFTALARDGRTTLYGALWKPTTFDQNKKYPIIDHSYTGPHTQVFPREYRRAFANQSLAELGFVVMMVDGLGSSGRSKAFHDHSYKNLGGNLTDHVGTIQQLGERYGWIDTTRVGIFGHSAGGYDAGRAVLAYPDFYDVAVASSADHDHRMEKAWWPEMYMGWPVDSAYHLQSNITNAGNLKGKLLITHGGIDENVNPSATFKLAEALIKADKQFDMLILPSQRHGYSNYWKYFTKLRWNYFVEHLRGETPIWDIDWDAK